MATTERKVIMARKYRIATLPGDGIGPDVLAEALRVLDALGFDAEFIHGDIGWKFWRTEGDPLPPRTIELLSKVNCALFGAITSKPKDEAAAELDPALQNQGFVYASPIVRLRQLLDLYSNLRPCKAFPGNPINLKEGVDLVIFRENTEDLYAGVEFFPIPEQVREALNDNHKKFGRFYEMNPDEVALSCRINTRKGCLRICRDAFEYALEHGYPTVTVVEKPNVIRETSGLMVRIAREIAQEYPNIELWETNIDAQCMWLVKNPSDYGVMVSSNMFGDIVSDLAAQLVGGLGFAASGNIGDEFAVFEPTHGSAPKHVGQNKVNPIAMIQAARLMLDWLGETKMAQRVHQAVGTVIREGKIRTYDIGGAHTMTQMTDAIIAAL